MIRSLREQLHVDKITENNLTSIYHSRLFLINYLRARRVYKTAAPIRASLGSSHWLIARKNARSQPRAPRITCFITGRTRGLSQRFSVARTKIKELSSDAMLPGVMKSSW